MHAPVGDEEKDYSIQPRLKLPSRDRCNATSAAPLDRPADASRMSFCMLITLVYLSCGTDVHVVRSKLQKFCWVQS